MKKGDLLDICVTIRLPDPHDPKLGGTLEHFIQMCDAVAGKWAQDLMGMGIDVFRHRIDQIEISKSYPRNGKT